MDGFKDTFSHLYQYTDNQSTYMQIGNISNQTQGCASGSDAGSASVLVSSESLH